MRLKGLITILLVVSACASRETAGVLHPAVVTASPDSSSCPQPASPGISSCPQPASQGISSAPVILSASEESTLDTTRTILETFAANELDSLELAAFQQASSLDQIQYLIDRKELEIARLQARQSRLFVLIFFLLAVIATLFWYFRARKLLTEKQLAEEHAETERLLSVAEDLQSRLSARRPEREVLERLCEQYYIYEGTDNLKPKVLGEVNSLINTLRRDPFYLLDDRTAATVRSLQGTLKDDDVHLLAYLAAGLSNTTLSTLTGRDKQNVYNRVHRLKERLAALPNGETYLSLIRSK